MPGARPSAIDLAQLQHQLQDLTQATSFQAAIVQCSSVMQAGFNPQACAIVWHGPDGLQILGTNAPAQVPDPAPQEWLSTGGMDFDYSDPPQRCFTPLRATGALLGWLYLEQPAWQADSPAMLSMLALSAAPVLALLDAAERHAQHTTQLRTIAEIGQTLGGALDLEVVLDTLYQACRRVLEISSFAIALYRPTDDMLELAYTVSDGERLHPADHWRPAEDLSGVLIARRAPLLTDDYQALCHIHGVAPRAPGGLPLGQAWLGLPLFAHDLLVGVIIISSRQPGVSYRRDHAEVLAAIAPHAASAIQNARLYQQSANQARQLEALNRIGRIINSSLDPERVPSLIMTQVCQLLNVAEGSLLLMDAESGELVFAYTDGPVGTRLLGQRLPQGAGLAGYVVSSGKSVIVNDAQHDLRFYANTDQSTGFVTRTLMAVPLRGVGGVQGVIEVLNRRNDQSFTNADLRLLEAVADQAVVALENAHRFAKVDQALARRVQELAQTNAMLEHNLQSLTALNALSLAINTTLRSPDEIFGMTAHGVMEMTGAHGATVLLLEGGQLHSLVQIGSVWPYNSASPIVERMLLTGRPEVRQSETGTSTLLAVPLRATQRMLGALCVYYPEHAPAPPDQETVVLFAAQAAAAVESIELFTDVRRARDQMASILASTREGIALIGPDSQLALANKALHRLCGVASSATPQSLAQFLSTWEQTSTYPRAEWLALRRGLEIVMQAEARFISGELTSTESPIRSLEWAVLTAYDSSNRHGGALLVLRDISHAKEAERLRQDLTHMIVHDLRTPLASVMASIELLIKGVSGMVNSAQLNILQIAHISAIQLLEMVNTLLDINRLENNRMPLDLAESTATRLITQASERLSSLAREQGILIQHDISAALPQVRVDEELIVRVIQNLLGNALKFSSRGSTVLVRVCQASDPAMVQVAVIDCGIGIAPGDLEKIFTKFSQVGERRGGTGLGLTFCKLAVEAHGGQIWVESTPGSGSAFFFTLPSALAPPTSIDRA